MKTLLIALITLSSITSSFAGENCKHKAFRIGRALDLVYNPLIVKGTKIAINKMGETGATVKYSVDFIVPQNNGATSYTIILEKESCFIKHVSMISN